MGRFHSFGQKDFDYWGSKLSQHFPRRDFLDQPRIGLILGTGWSNPAVLEKEGFICEMEISFAKLGLNSKSGSGHPNAFKFGTWHGENVVISAGRFHRFQDNNVGKDSLIRRWMALLIYFMNGSNRLVITSAVGGLGDRAKEDMIVMPTGIVSAHLPMPFLIGSDGEFVMSEHLLSSSAEMYTTTRIEVLASAAMLAECQCLLTGTHYVVPGPGFGGATERRLWASWGCDTVGMSLDPELRLIAVENMDNRPTDAVGLFQETDIRVFPALFVSDAHDIPDNNEIQARAQLMAPKLGKFLSHIVQSKW